MAFDSKKFLVRTGSAAVFVIVLLGCILWNYYSFSALFFIVSLWGLNEFYKLMELNGNKPNKIIGYILSISLYGFITSWIIQDSIKDEAVISVLQFFSRVLFALISIVSLLIPLVELFRNKEKPLENISITFYGVVYVVMPFILFNLVANYPLGGGYLTEGMRYQSSIVISVFLLIWSNLDYWLYSRTNQIS
ncbi:MAG: phosphatidate cytidylyltransferase [Bacteroidia bacterium]